MREGESRHLWAERETLIAPISNLRPLLSVGSSERVSRVASMLPAPKLELNHKSSLAAEQRLWPALSRQVERLMHMTREEAAKSRLNIMIVVFRVVPLAGCSSTARTGESNYPNSSRPASPLPLIWQINLSALLRARRPVLGPDTGGARPGLHIEPARGGSSFLFQSTRPDRA